MNKKLKNVALFVFAMALITGCKDGGGNVTSTDGVVEIEFIKQGELEFLDADGNSFKKIDIEIADTPNKRGRGLMDRSAMDENRGMLFIFDDDDVRKHTFYMKDTRIPMDIMYFDRDSVLINIAREAQPGADSEMGGGTVAAAAEDSKFVVEINGGLAEKWGITEGETKISWIRN